MFKHVLVATDGSELSGKAVDAAVRLAGTCHAQLTAVHISPPYVPPMDNDGPVAAAQYDPREHRRVAEAEAKRVLDAVVTAARAAGLPCDTRDVTDSQPWNGILRAAEQAHCDAIVMASHGRRGLSALLIGSETTKVLTHSKIPVLVCR